MDNNYYVYVYCDPRMSLKQEILNINFSHIPFYIGKGLDDRIESHKYDKSNSPKVKRIKEIEKFGLLPIKEKIFENLTENQAFYFEALLIDKIKLVKHGGTLLNQIKPNLKKWDERKESDFLEYPYEDFDPQKIVKYDPIKYVILKENTTEVLSIHYTLSSAAKFMGVTKSLAENLSENYHPYNILRGKILLKRENLLKYFQI